MNFLKRYFYPLLSGILIGTSYIPFPPWAIFFCYIPLWLFALKQKKLKPLLIGAWLSQFTLSLIGFNWIIFTIREFGNFSWPLSVIGFLCFATFANLHIPISLAFWFFSKKQFEKIQRPSLSSLCIWLLLPIYTALGFKYYPMIFDWHLGYTWFYAGWPASQTAEIWGFQFINTMILFSNLSFLFVLKKFRSKKGFLVLLSWTIAFIGISQWGKYLKNRWPEPDQKARVLVVQPNISPPSRKKARRNSNSLIISKLMDETKKHILKEQNSIDFILWPEGAYPYNLKDFKLKRKDTLIQKLIQKLQTPMVVSAIGQSSEGATNSIFVFNKKGELIEKPYHKTVLLVFGEYLPFENILPVNQLLPYYGDSFKRGTGANKVIELNGIHLGFQVCYEALFDDLTRDLAKNHVNILINVANESWFGDGQERWQHLYMSLARSIEIRRPILRGTNSGISAFVSAKGDIENLSQINKVASWIQDIPYTGKDKEKQSVFTLWGYFINTYFCWILFLVIHFYWIKVHLTSISLKPFIKTTD